MGLLRLLLALSVLIIHSGPVLGIPMGQGEIEVKSFFIISGFYMSLVLHEKYTEPQGNYLKFIAARLTRLLPMYWAMIILILCSALAIYLYSRGQHLGPLNTYAEHHQPAGLLNFLFFILTHLSLLGQDLYLFFALDPQTGGLVYTSDFTVTNPPLYSFQLIPQAWSLSLEIMFYLLAPLLVRRKIWVLLGLMGLSLGLRLWIYDLGYAREPWTDRFFPTEFIFFLAGILSYRLYGFLKTHQLPSALSYGTWALIILFTLLYAWIPFQGKSLIYFCLIGLCIPLLFRLTKEDKIDRYLGDLSYPVYLSHMFLLVLLMYLKIPLIQSVGTTLLLLTLPFAIAMHEWIGKPVEKWRSRLYLKNKTL